MSTPNPEVLYVFDGATGLPYTGLASDLAFVEYVDDTGASVTPPTIAKVKDGIFKFTPVFSGHAIYYLIESGESPAFFFRYMRPEEADADSVSTIAASVTEIATDTDTILTNLATAQTAITEIATDTDTAITNVAAVQTTVTEIATDTDTILTNLATAQTGVTAIASGTASVLAAVTTLLNIETGKWKIFTSGGDANRLVIYEPDGTTVLMKFNLLDSSGSATSSAPFARVPV